MLRYAAAIVAVLVVVALGEAFGYLRAAGGVAMFAGIFVVGARYIHFLLNAPPDPEPQDVRDQGLRYVCQMCGLELRVEVAAKEKPPTHCMEPMVLLRDGGGSLRPLD